MSWEYDFLRTAAELFNLFVLTLLPITVLVIFLVYLKKILVTWVETRRMHFQAKRARK
ncbi:MAG: hypothetical protein QXU73_07600 [Thermoplasmata archaeon]